MDEQTDTQMKEDNAITLGDIILMHNIIATVSRRGGFEAAEFQVVGQLFEKLKSYIPKTEEGNAETANTSEEECNDGQTQFEFVQDDTTKSE